MKDVQGEGATTEDLIVEGTNVKFGAELILGVLAKLENFQLSEFVSKSLSRPGDVTINFSLNIGLIHGGVAMEISDHLIAGPVLLVNAGVDGQTDGTPHFIF